jgi:SAM-dependent methyltransferase
MSGFSVEWLALREPLDMRARNRAVLGAVAAAFNGRSDVSIVDLGSGTGSTLRALGSQLAASQKWTLVDNDPVLLAEAFARAQASGATVETRQFDLADDIAPLFDADTAFVTTSALLDLVSEPWLANLAAAAAARSLSVYAALSYDGRVTFSSSDPVDAQVIAAVNAHQLGNKGFGPALGPRAVAAAERIFRALGYSFVQGTSDWEAGPSDRDFQHELLAGWRQAAAEMGGLPCEALEGWFARRRAATDAGALNLTVGHVDFFAQPRER